MSACPPKRLRLRYSFGARGRVGGAIRYKAIKDFPNPLGIRRLTAAIPHAGMRHEEIIVVIVMIRTADLLTRNCTSLNTRQKEYCIAINDSPGAVCVVGRVCYNNVTPSGL